MLLCKRTPGWSLYFDIIVEASLSKVPLEEHAPSTPQFHASGYYMQASFWRPHPHPSRPPVFLSFYGFLAFRSDPLSTRVSISQVHSARLLSLLRAEWILLAKFTLICKKKCKNAFKGFVKKNVKSWCTRNNHLVFLQNIQKFDFLTKKNMLGKKNCLTKPP